MLRQTKSAKSFTISQTHRNNPQVAVTTRSHRTLHHDAPKYDTGGCTPDCTGVGGCVKNINGSGIDAACIAPDVCYCPEGWDGDGAANNPKSSSSKKQEKRKSSFASFFGTDPIPCRPPTHKQTIKILHLTSFRSSDPSFIATSFHISNKVAILILVLGAGS